jgi:hypothetical protein
MPDLTRYKWEIVFGSSVILWLLIIGGCVWLLHP